jgi:membrane-bound metal-dependent hydrolase YbcI (DUF457 family)
MFAGHYAPAFAAKALKRPPSLGAAFVAVQLVDFAWAGFILTGVEHARLTPGFLALSDLDLYHMPWTHSLAAALAWSMLGALVYALLDRKSGWPAAVAIGALVFSHWVLDLLVHAPDLALYPGSPERFGLGLWDNPPLWALAELGLFALCFAIYMRATRANGAAGRFAPWLTAALMLGVLAFEKLGPAQDDIRQAAASALIAYAVFAGLGFWLDRVRSVRA